MTDSALDQPLPELKPDEFLVVSVHTPMPARTAATVMRAVADACRAEGFEAVMHGPHVIARPVVADPDRPTPRAVGTRAHDHGRH